MTKKTSEHFEDVGVAEDKVHEERQNCGKQNGRWLVECLVCGEDNAAEVDWNGQTGPSFICHCCGVIYELAARLIRPPSRKCLTEKGVHSTALALVGTKKLKEKHRTEAVKSSAPVAPKNEDDE